MVDPELIPIGKAVRNDRGWIAHTLRFAQRTGQPLRESHSNAHLVRLASGYAYRCADINASRVAATPLKVVRKARSTTGRKTRLAYKDLRSRLQRGDGSAKQLIADFPWPARPVSRQTRRWLDGKAMSHRGPQGPSQWAMAKASSMQGDLEEVVDHPLLTLLMTPNADENTLSQ